MLTVRLGRPPHSIRQFYFRQVWPCLALSTVGKLTTNDAHFARVDGSLKSRATLGRKAISLELSFTPPKLPSLPVLVLSLLRSWGLGPR